VPQRASAWPPPLSQHGPLQRRLWWLSPPRRRLGAALLAAESRCFSVLRVDEQSVQSFRKRLRRTHGRSCRHQYARCISSGPWTSLSKSCTRSSSPPSRACALPMFAVHVCAGGWVGWRTRVRGGLPVQTCTCTRKHPCAPVRVRRHGLAPNPPTHPKPQSLAAPEPNYSLGLNLCSEAQPKCGVGGGASLHPRTIVDTRARTHTLRSSPRLTPPLRPFLGANCGGSVRPPSGAEVYLEVY
jgi:hypothetical protein